MDQTLMEKAVTDGIDGLRLLEHPFYRRWDAGGLLPGELAAYGAQYRHFEVMVPGFLRAVAEALPEGEARRAVLGNLKDELGDPVPHIELFDRFADAVGAEPCAASQATAALVDAYLSVAARGPSAALAGLAAYEYQASEVASSKARGLREHYGLPDSAVIFWDHHAVVEVEHSRWTIEALAESDAEEVVVAEAARVVAEAWWRFLDERDSFGLEAPHSVR